MGKTRRSVAAHGPPRARTGAPRLYERFSRRDLSHAQLHSEVAEWKLLDLTREDMERYALEAAVEEDARKFDPKTAATLDDFVTAAEAVLEYNYVEGAVGPDEGEDGPAEEVAVAVHEHGEGAEHEELHGGEEVPAAAAAAAAEVPENDYGGGGGAFEKSPAEDEGLPDHGGGGEDVPAAAVSAENDYDEDLAVHKPGGEAFEESPAENDVPDKIHGGELGREDPVPETNDDDDDVMGNPGPGVAEEEEDAAGLQLQG